MKKLLFAAAILFSAATAHAGYIQYNLNGDGLRTGYPGSSFVIIRDSDKSVAFYQINTQLGYFMPGDAMDSYHKDFLTDSSSNFWGLQPRNMNWGIGPSNFSLKDIWLEDSTSSLSINFTQGANPTTFNYSMRIITGPGPYSPYPNLFPSRDVVLRGEAVTASVSDYMANLIDTNSGNGMQQQFFLPHIVPTQNVPEPSSLALIALGAIGLARIARRKA